MIDSNSPVGVPRSMKPRMFAVHGWESLHEFLGSRLGQLRFSPIHPRVIRPVHPLLAPHLNPRAIPNHPRLSSSSEQQTAPERKNRPMPPTDPLVRVEQVTRKFPLDHSRRHRPRPRQSPDRRRRIPAISGPSGSGKSTLSTSSAASTSPPAAASSSTALTPRGLVPRKLPPCAAKISASSFRPSTSSPFSRPRKRRVPSARPGLQLQRASQTRRRGTRKSLASPPAHIIVPTYSRRRTSARSRRPCHRAPSRAGPR